MVLSQFCTFTVVRLISCTVPSALPTAIQSPMRSMSLIDSCMLPTKPLMESWKISIRTAEIVPKPMMML